MVLKVKRTKKTTQTRSPYFKKKKVKTEETIVLSGVPDNLLHDLKVMFVGINPGLTSAAKCHHYAGPTNHFWPALTQSGLVDTKVTFEDDITLPERYGLGFTNLTARPSRRASDLTLAEQRAGIPILNEKIVTWRPRVACFIGKGIFEIYSGKKCNTMGLQSSEFDLDWDGGKTVIFVMPSTSGIVSAYNKADRIRFFQDLCQVTNRQVDLFPIPPKLEQEKLEQEKLKQEKLEQEKLEQEKLKQEKLEQENLEQVKLEQVDTKTVKVESIKEESAVKIESDTLNCNLLDSTPSNKDAY